MPSTLRHELARKSIHLASAAVPVAYHAGAPRAAVLAALAAAGAAAATIEVARHRLPRARAAFDGLVGALLRPHERDRWSGATWLCAAYALAVLVFPRAEAVAAMLAVAVGDAAAAVVGRAAGARRVRALHVATVDAATDDVRRAVAAPGGKTWAGSVACAVAASAAALFVAQLAAPAALACGAAAALAERPRGPFDDNVRIAAAAGAAAWLVRALA